MVRVVLEHKTSGYKRIKEALFIFWIVGVVVLFIALFSHNSQDMQISSSQNVENINNAIGIVGARLSETLLEYLGLSAYILPFLLLYIGYIALWNDIRFRDIEYGTIGVRIIGCNFLLISICTLLYKANFDSNNSKGGHLGYFIYEIIYPYLGYVGTILLMLSCFVSGLVLFTGISLTSICGFVGEVVTFPFVKRKGRDESYFQQLLAKLGINSNNQNDENPKEEPSGKGESYTFEKTKVTPPEAPTAPLNEEFNKPEVNLEIPGLSVDPLDSMDLSKELLSEDNNSQASSPLGGIDPNLTQRMPQNQNNNVSGWDSPVNQSINEGGRISPSSVKINVEEPKNDEPKVDREERIEPTIDLNSTLLNEENPQLNSNQAPNSLNANTNQNDSQNAQAPKYASAYVLPPQGASRPKLDDLGLMGSDYLTNDNTQGAFSKAPEEVVAPEKEKLYNESYKPYTFEVTKEENPQSQVSTQPSTQNLNGVNSQSQPLASNVAPQEPLNVATNPTTLGSEDNKANVNPESSNVFNINDVRANETANEQGGVLPDGFIPVDVANNNQAETEEADEFAGFVDSPEPKPVVAAQPTVETKPNTQGNFFNEPANNQATNFDAARNTSLNFAPQNKPTFENSSLKPDTHNSVPKISASPKPLATFTSSYVSPSMTNQNSQNSLSQSQNPTTQGGYRYISNIGELAQSFGESAGLVVEGDDGKFPPLKIFTTNEKEVHISEEKILNMIRRIDEAFRHFNIQAHVAFEENVDQFGNKSKKYLYECGPVITRFKIRLVKGLASGVVRVCNDIARSLCVGSMRVIEIIPGEPYIGLEIPNPDRGIISMRNLLESEAFINAKGALPMVVGKNIIGKPVVLDLAQAPHLLVAGTTGSGKSVGISTMIVSLLMRYTPEELRLILIDPKKLEFGMYHDIPHLLTPVIDDVKLAPSALRWAVAEMERRYTIMACLNVRNIKHYNELIEKCFTTHKAFIKDPTWKPTDNMDTQAPNLTKFPYIVIVVDEFADLILQLKKNGNIEELLARLAAKARAAGIHLILATQSPRAEIITGSIRSNFPSQIAFKVKSNAESRIIIDESGAEDLLGKGDMLIRFNDGTNLTTRAHGAFITDREIEMFAESWRRKGKPQYVEEVLKTELTQDNALPGESVPDPDESDEVIYSKLLEYCQRRKEKGQLFSVSDIRTHFSIGHQRACRMRDKLTQDGVISEIGNSRGEREIL